VTLTAFTADRREVIAPPFTFTVAPAPIVTVTLAASSASTNLATPVTFTATVSTVGATGAITSYEWDFDGNGTTDRTSAGNTTAWTYTTLGAKTARVRAISAAGKDGTATVAVTVSDLALALALSVAPAVTQPAGTPLTVTATVTTLGTAPAAASYAWDYTNDGTVDEVTTGNTVTVVYNGTAFTRTLSVTVTAADGRTATNTVQIPVS
jgi:hypothetical protein